MMNMLAAWPRILLTLTLLGMAVLATVRMSGPHPGPARAGWDTPCHGSDLFYGTGRWQGYRFTWASPDTGLGILIHEPSRYEPQAHGGRTLESGNVAHDTGGSPYCLAQHGDVIVWFDGDGRYFSVIPGAGRIDGMQAPGRLWGGMLDVPWHGLVTWLLFIGGLLVLVVPKWRRASGWALVAMVVLGWAPFVYTAHI